MSLKIQSFYPSQPALNSQVEVYRLVETHEEIQGETVANARMDAVITLRGKISVFDFDRDCFVPLPECCFFPFTRRGTSRTLLAADTRLINIKFYPHVLGADCFSGHDFQIPLAFDKVFGTDLSLNKEHQPDSLVSLLDTFFEKHLLNDHTDQNLLNQVFTFVETESNRADSLSTLARNSGVSIKTLERHFKNSTGLTIKMYQDLVRFQKAARQINANGHYHHGDLLEALGSGYYDQSHFVKACRKLTGLTPRELFSRLPGEITDFVVF